MANPAHLYPRSHARAILAILARIQAVAARLIAPRRGCMITGRLVGLWAIALALVVAGCAAPQFTYVTNSSAHTYFKVPSGWRKISDTALAHAISGGSSSKTSAWTVGYDGSTDPAASHVLSQLTTQP